jgi:hypothetical protein
MREIASFPDRLIVSRQWAQFIGSRFRPGGVISKHNVIFRRVLVAKPNYRHAKKQKEAARKARQDAKQQRRSTAPETAFAADAPVEPVPAKSVE